MRDTDQKLTLGAFFGVSGGCGPLLLAWFDVLCIKVGLAYLETHPLPCFAACLLSIIVNSLSMGQAVRAPRETAVPFTTTKTKHNPP